MSKAKIRVTIDPNGVCTTDVVQCSTDCFELTDYMLRNSEVYSITRKDDITLDQQQQQNDLHLEQ